MVRGFGLVLSLCLSVCCACLVLPCLSAVPVVCLSVCVCLSVRLPVCLSAGNIELVVSSLRGNRVNRRNHHHSSRARTPRGPGTLHEVHKAGGVPVAEDVLRECIALAQEQASLIASDSA